jgi:hypothetical protein
MGYGSTCFNVQRPITDRTGCHQLVLLTICPAGLSPFLGCQTLVAWTILGAINWWVDCK